MTISKSARKEIIRKLAKKEHVYGLSGKHNRKSVEKVLSKTTEKYNSLKKILDNAEEEAARLNSLIENTRNELKNARHDIITCHDILRNMDFSGASEVKINKEDTAYACDGKWVYYDSESGDKIPYSKWKKEQKEKESENNDVSDVNDSNVEDDYTDLDGVDITV